jgi:hypothetical protein
LSNISQLRNLLHRTISRSPDAIVASTNRGKAMRAFASAFLSAIAAVSISGALFSAVLI